MIRAYASYFVSYFLANFKHLSNLKRIILFGSAAKDEATKESDVDLFIELKKDNKQIRKEIEVILKEFYKSREALLFKTKGIDNKINIIFGELAEWKDLKKSIESTGILLYGNYITGNVEGKKHTILFWDKIGKNRGAFLNRVYGFRVGNKKYKGLIEIYNGKKLGKSCIIIPIEYREEIFKLLKHYNVNARLMDVYA